jgi:hypothetical protein
MENSKIAAIHEKFESIQDFFGQFETRRAAAESLKSDLVNEIATQSAEYNRMLLIGDGAGSVKLRKRVDALFERARIVDDTIQALKAGSQAFVHEISSRETEITQLAREIHQEGAVQLECLGERYGELLGPKMEEVRKALFAILEEAGEISRQASGIASAIHRTRCLIPQEERVKASAFKDRFRSPLAWQSQTGISDETMRRAFGVSGNWTQLGIYDRPRWHWADEQADDAGVIHGLHSPEIENVF